MVPADKGRATVVLDTQDYKDKTKQLLADTNTYRILDHDPTQEYKQKFKRALTDMETQGALTHKQVLELIPTGEPSKILCNT